MASLCPRQAQAASQTSQRRRRNGHLAALLDPRVPGRAQPADLGHLLAPEARRTPPGPGSEPVCGRCLALPQRTQECTQGQRWIVRDVSFHGGSYTRMTCTITLVPWEC